MQPTSKAPAIVGVLLVIGAVFYYFYTASNAVPVSPESSLSISSGLAGAGGATVGADVLNLLSQIKGLNIDTSFFQSSTYESLNDFSVTIPAEPVGKADPFIPIPGAAVPPAR